MKQAHFVAFEQNRVDGTGGAGGAQAPPSFLDLCSKNYKISQIREENSFFSLVVPPHKKFVSVNPAMLLKKFKNIPFFLDRLKIDL